MDKEKFWIIVYQYIGDDAELTEEYYDFDDARADYAHMIQDEPDEYKYVVLQEVFIDDTGYEEIKNRLLG